MKAIHQVQVKKPVAEKNVMNTIHNVTVTSPPPVRKELASTQAAIETIPRERTKTRTLEPEEVLILNKSKTDVTTIKSLERSIDEVEQKPILVKEAIAFEINFEKPTISQPVAKVNLPNIQAKDVSDEYEDDFNSYESDFESGSSSSSDLSSKSSNSGNSSNDSTSPKDLSSQSEKQITFVTEKKTEEDREFDSGTYELKGVVDKLQLDSIDERDHHSDEQNDSGFG